MHTQLVELEHKIAELQQLVNQLQATHSINPMDKDLLKQKCVALYEQVIGLEVNIAQAVIPPPSQVELTPVDEPEEEEIPEIILMNDIPPVEEKPTPAMAPVTDLFAEITPTEIQNKQIEEIIEIQQQILEETPNPLMKEEVQEISLHEKIAFAIPVKPNLSEKLAGESIPSLKSAINVNLKIAIVNDLFKENTVEYVKAIDKLNNSENIHEAMRYFTELKHTYDWDNQNSLVKELESLINKRFS